LVILNDINIRPAVATDLSRLTDIDPNSTSDYVWQLDLRKENGQISVAFREVRLPRPVPITYPRNPLALSDDWVKRSIVFVAILADSLVGYACVLEHSKATTAWVTDLVVREEERRRGVGSALLNAAQDWAASRGDRDIFIEMSSKNNPAIRLAQKLGFDFCGYNDHYYVTQDVALFFGKSLL
jgi:GNAT superfamily N-acetyltransferase